MLRALKRKWGWICCLSNRLADSRLAALSLEFSRSTFAFSCRRITKFCTMMVMVLLMNASSKIEGRRWLNTQEPGLGMDKYNSRGSELKKNTNANKYPT